MRFDIGGAVVELREDGDRVCAHMFTGGFETESLIAWGEVCGAGGTVLDIGAYTGIYAISAARLGCKVIAFEPLPANAHRLRENAEANGVLAAEGRALAKGRVEVRQKAVSDRDGAATLGYNSRVILTSGASLVGHAKAKVPVQTVTIDSLNLRQLSAIKIDVERGEPQVIAGARDTLTRCRPALLVEVLDEVRKDALIALLPDYRIAKVLDARNWLMLPC